MTIQPLTIIVGAAPLTISTTTLLAGTLGAPYSASLSVNGGSPPYTWFLASGSLPNGLTLSGSGVVSGTPNVAGAFTFTVRVTDAASTAAIKTLGLEISYPTGFSGPPSIAPGGIVSAGGMQSGLRSGSWATIFGSNLSATTRDWATSDFSGNAFPTILDSVSVSVTGKQAFIRSIAPGQINFQVPDGIGLGQVPVLVTNPAGTSSAGSATIAIYAPAFFIGASVNSRNYVAATEALPQGTAYIGPAAISGLRPAVPGEILTLWATGFGPTRPDVPAGTVFTAAAPLADSVQILIDDVVVLPEFGGLTGAGLYQFNIVVPNVPAGDHRLKATIASTSTPDGIWLATQ
jgi:uncharacterized protein (TIGR03437 family)